MHPYQQKEMTQADFEKHFDRLCDCHTEMKWVRVRYKMMVNKFLDTLKRHKNARYVKVM